MSVEDPQFSNAMFNQYPSPPYLPPSSSDPGIPPTPQRPSIRERGLIIWILILTLFSACTSLSQEDVYGETSRALAEHGFMYDENEFNDYGDFVRNPVQESVVDGTTALWSVVTNQTARAFTFHDVQVSGLPEGVTADYLSGVQTIAPGESVLIVLAVNDNKALTDQQLTSVEFENLVPANIEPVYMSVMDYDDSTLTSSVIDAYEGLVAQLVAAQVK